jgi:CRP/FNR family transcriptional regulator
VPVAINVDEGNVSKSCDEVLSACRLLAQVGAQRRRRLAEISRLCQLPTGRTIFREGEPCPGVYAVDRGMVRILKIGPSGKEHVLHMVGPGFTFGEVAAIGNFPCPAHAEAIADTTCVLIPADPFRQALTEDHQLCLEMITGLSMWVRQLVTLMEDVVLRDAAGRVARYLLECEAEAEATVKLPSLKRHVASHLNLTSETFSRTLSRLVEAGLVVELDGGRVQLRDRDGLRAVSEGLIAKI